MQSGVEYMLREALVWCLTISITFISVFYYEDILAYLDPARAALQKVYAQRAERSSAETGFERSVRLTADRNGHFAVDAYVNDRPLSLVADTGATFVTLTYEDAREAGVRPGEIDYSARTRTANGVAKVAPITLRHVRIGSIKLRDVPAVVAEPGRLSVSLLGMSFLGALTRFEMRGRELVLVQ